MFIELVDVLRCPSPHQESWLVLAATRVDDRDVMAGTLGCPVCHAEYPIADGIARFDGGTRRLTTVRTDADEEEALRLAALLDLSDPGGYAVLLGARSAHAPLVATMTDVQLLLVDPPSGIGMGIGLSGLTTPAHSAVLPLAAGTARGIALDQTATPGLARAAVDVLKTGGRLVGPAVLPLPPGVTELARDESWWVAARTAVGASSGIVALTRRR
jgi:uncharacterized protein YbaR (Trm112 family)